MAMTVSAVPQSLVLVTPVWNDSLRLGRFGPSLARALTESGLPVRWIVADDGSPVEEQVRVQDLVGSFRELYPHVESMLFTERSHKGGAIYSAWDACPDADWVGFVDADGAIDADSTVRLLKHALAQGKAGGCVGVRHDAKETPVKRPFYRALSFRLFSFVMHRLIGIRFEDTQCGAKVVPGSAYHHVAPSLKERGYIFDVELLLALDLHGCRIEELRIPWSEMDGGKVHPFRDAWPMLAGLLRIRKRLQRGEY